MPEEKTVREEVDDIKQEICDKYCKYTDGKYIVTDDIIETYCAVCPLTRL